MASLLTLQLVCCCLTVEVLNQPREPACEASEQASNTNPSKGPGAQGSGSSAARGCSTTPSAACDGEPSVNFVLSYLFQYAMHQCDMIVPAYHKYVCFGHAMAATV
jgi:hypothetical protein